MKRRTGNLLVAAVILTLCLTGCGESKAAKEARLQGITQMNEGNYTEAIGSFETALKEADGVVNKFELDILEYRGEAEYHLGDYAAASHTYGILNDVGGKQPECLYYKAAADARLGDIAAAMEEYNTAAETDLKMNRNVNGAETAVTAIGKACMDSGEYDLAMNFYQNAVDSGKVTAAIYNQMGLSMMQGKKYDEAIGFFDQGIALGDEAVTKELLYNKGAAYEYRGDFAKALEVLSGYVSTYGSTPELEKELTFLRGR